MAGIFIWHKSQQHDPDSINSAFRSLDYKNGRHLKSKDWNVLVFPKTTYNIQNYQEFDEGFICGTGTFSYKGLIYEKALKLMFQELKDDKLDLTSFWGNFIVFASINTRTILIRDGAHLARLHRLRGKPVLTNSFVGLLRSSEKKLSFDRDSATELLSTGLITGNSTIINEIEFITDSLGIKDLHYMQSSVNEIPSKSSRQEALSQQVELALSFVKQITSDWNNYMPGSHFNVSITGGLDSRLLTALILETKSEFDFYTYWRHKNSADSDYRLALNVANHLKIKLNSAEPVIASNLQDNELIKLFRSSHNSCDGVIRPGTFWDEDFSTIAYRQKLSSPPYLRVTGFEGEYYRNMERLPLETTRSYQSWVRWEMIYRFAGHNFLNKKDQNNTEERIITNLEKLLGPGSLNLVNFKTYYRKAVVPSYRSFQVNLENKSGFLISPFADTNLSHHAFNAIPFLGKSLQFEVDMLRMISPDLASLPNDYGIDFLKGENLKSKASIELWQYLPPSIKYKLYAAYKNNYKSGYISSLSANSKFVNTLIENVYSVNLPLKIDSILQRNVRGRLVLNLGFFLQENKNWLSW